MLKIIGVGHRKRVGKDEFSDSLVNRLNDREDFFAAMKVSLSAPLFDAAAMLFPHHCGVLNEIADGSDTRKDEVIPGTESFTPRDIAKLLGNLARSVEKDTLMKAAMYNAEALSVKFLVIPNIRFPDEVKFVKRHEGVLVRVTRPGFMEPESPPDPFDEALAGFDDWDYEVKNGGTLQELRSEEVDKFLSFLYGGLHEE